MISVLASVSPQGSSIQRRNRLKRSCPPEPGLIGRSRTGVPFHKPTDRKSSQKSDLARRNSDPVSRMTGSFSLFKTLKLWKNNSIQKLPADSLKLSSKYKAHFIEIFRTLSLIKTLKPEDYTQVYLRMKNLPRKKDYHNRKTLVIDLDETLIHCGGPGSEQIQMFSEEGSSLALDIEARPFATGFLEEVSKTFEVIVFSASSQNYADAVVDHLDPNGTLVQHRLYRDDCIPTPEGTFIKDLRILNRNIEDIVIVDNSVWSFARQLDNGIPLLPWTGDPSDRELQNLVPFLKDLENSCDVRELIGRTFRLHSF